MIPEPVVEAARRYAKIIINTDEEWNLVASQKPSLLEALFPFTAMGLVLQVLAFMAGYLLRSFRGPLVIEFILIEAVYLVPLVLFTVSSVFLAGKVGAVRKDLTPAACLYSFAPAWAISVLHIVPVFLFGWLWTGFSIILVSVLFAKGSRQVIGVPEGKSLLFVSVGLAALGFPMLLLMLIRHLWLFSLGVL